MDKTHYSQIEGPTDGKKVFKKLGTCSRTFFHILNREFGHPKELEERAADALAGGIMQKGHQCGMLWGASLAVGAEAYRQCKTQDEAIRVAVNATQELMRSFSDREHTINCREITNCDWTSNWSIAKYFISGKFFHCFNLAQDWAPEAVQSAIIGLTEEQNSPKTCMSCATEVARRMGASDEEMIMVAGFAGGLGLSGAACGALAAAVWLRSIKWCREVPNKMAMSNPYAKQTVATFHELTGAKILCSEITGVPFATIDEHAKFIHYGGCKEIIDVLVQSKIPNKINQ